MQTPPVEQSLSDWQLAHSPAEPLVPPEDALVPVVALVLPPEVAPAVAPLPVPPVEPSVRPVDAEVPLLVVPEFAPAPVALVAVLPVVCAPVVAVVDDVEFVDVVELVELVPVVVCTPVVDEVPVVALAVPVPVVALAVPVPVFDEVRCVPVEVVLLVPVVFSPVVPVVVVMCEVVEPEVLLTLPVVPVLGLDVVPPQPTMRPVRATATRQLFNETDMRCSRTTGFGKGAPPDAGAAPVFRGLISRSTTYRVGQVRSDLTPGSSSNRTGCV